MLFRSLEKVATIGAWSGGRRRLRSVLTTVSPEQMAEDPRSVFHVKSALKVLQSSTVICARRRGNEPLKSASRPEATIDAGTVASWSSASKSVNANPVLSNLFRGEAYNFMNNWEVLLGQSEVINYLKSKPDKLKTMRYGGEYKLAGGNVDAGETVEACAKRELNEEFLMPLGIPTEKVKVRLFSVKQTRPVRSTSNMMNNYVALASENEWLATLDVEQINQGLKERRKRFRNMVKDGEYWKLSTEEKELISPEVHRVRWVPLEEAVRLCLSSMIPGSVVDDFQASQFKMLGKKRRDPMFITGATLIELEAFESEADLVSWSDQLDLKALQNSEQWLFQGMNNDQVMAAFSERLKANNGSNDSFKTPKQLEALRNQVRSPSVRSKL